MRWIVSCGVYLALGLWGETGLWAGGSGWHVAVVVNQASSNSVALGNYYSERRQVPPQNLLRINWNGNNVSWTKAEYESILERPLRSMLLSRGLSQQIDYVVLSMDIPYRIQEGLLANSTTATLFYGFKTNNECRIGDCALACDSTNAYAGTEQAFRWSVVGANPSAFLATMITSSTLEEAKQYIDQGVKSDATFPSQPVVLVKTSDVARNGRHSRFDNAIFDLRLAGGHWMRSNSDDLSGLTNLLGLQLGLANFFLPPNRFVPGAMADSLTSFGGLLFEPTSQTSLLAFLRSGAAGSYGTVVEPCNYLEKFPDPLAFFYQRRGFSLAESYYQSIANPYQGLVVGEPLAAPFAAPGSGQWLSPAGSAAWHGIIPLAFEFAARDARHPLQQVDLIVDGLLFQTITNLTPSAGEVLSIRLNHFMTNYVVPQGADLSRVTRELADLLNSEPVASQTEVTVLSYGDRLELAFTNLVRSGADVALEARVAPPFPQSEPTLFVTASSTNFLDSLALGRRSFTIKGVPATGDYLELQITKITGERISASITNTSASIGLEEFTRQWMAQINATPALQASDGAVADDLVMDGTNTATLNLYARAPGLAAAQIYALVSGAPNLFVSPENNVALDENRSDLYPRNHLYLAVGANRLACHYPLDTTRMTDGYHELSAVAYEGTSVRTQTRLSQAIFVQNTSLRATLSSADSSGLARFSDFLSFQVAAHTNLSRIELFSTGGLLGEIRNQSNSTFVVEASLLGAGVHPFYAIIAGLDGSRFRTTNLFLRIVNSQDLNPLPLQITFPPLRLAWPARAGQPYEILSTERLNFPFHLRERVTATNSGVLQWLEPVDQGGQQFYQVRGF